MRMIVSLISAFLCVTANTACADVRVDERYLAPAMHDAQESLLPDPLSAIALPDARARFLLRMPADGRISSPFGWRRDPIDGSRRFHAGLDIANLRSSRVVAAAPGRVVHAGAMAGCGLAVEIDHGGGLSTRYCHLDRIVARAGRRIAAGATLGLMGDTGRSTAPHLHFQLSIDGRPLDPAPFLWLAFARESR